MVNSLEIGERLPFSKIVFGSVSVLGSQTISLRTPTPVLLTQSVRLCLARDQRSGSPSPHTSHCTDAVNGRHVVQSHQASATPCWVSADVIRGAKGMSREGGEMGLGMGRANIYHKALHQQVAATML